MESLYDVLHALPNAQPGSVLATILHVEGSAYLKAGAMMLIRADGQQVGLLSPGCLEADLAARAHEVWAKQQASIVVYDLKAEDDLSWGAGAGCNGVIQVLVEPLDDALKRMMNQVRESLAEGVSVRIWKRLCADGSVAASGGVTEQGRTFGAWEGRMTGALHKALEEERQDQRQKRSGLHAVEGMEGVFYVQHMRPQPRLVIIGAGVDARPLAEIAGRCGLWVTVADWREGMCNTACFPSADELVLGRPDELLERLQLTPRDNVVLMTHHFQHDKELLRRLLQQTVQYLGVLGPRVRTSRLLDGAPIPERVRAPVGVAIGAVGAAEIAISILADVIDHGSGRMNREGRPG